MVTIHVPIREQRDASYDIVIGGALLGDLAGLLARHCPAARYAVITDSHVGPLYGEATLSRLRAAGLAAERFEFPAGESGTRRGRSGRRCATRCSPRGSDGTAP